MFTPIVAFLLIAFMVLFIVYMIWIVPLFQNAPTAEQNFRMVHPKWRGASAAKRGVLWKAQYKLVGLKQKLLTALVVTASTIVLAYDTIAPLIGTVDFTPITSQINPKWLVAANVAVPLVLLGFRKLAERRPRTI